MGQAAALHMATTIGQHQYAFRVAMAYEEALIAYKRALAGRNRDEGPEKQPNGETSDHGNSSASANALNDLNMHCEYHLLHVANFDDVHWKKADQKNDLRGVLVAYCGALLL